MTDDVTVVRVFTAADGAFGNPLGVIRSEVAADRRQQIATALGYSETVFVDESDPTAPTVVIHTPAAELPFAGHPLVGTAWLLGQEAGRAPDTLRVAAGTVAVRIAEDGLTWISGRAEWASRFDMVQLASPSDVEGLGPVRPAGANLYFWAWEDEAAGHLRSRMFAAAGPIEDQATGGAAVRICALLDRPLRIRQGEGSVLHAEPGEDGTIRVGGHVVHAGTRPFPESG